MDGAITLLLVVGAICLVVLAARAIGVLAEAAQATVLVGFLVAFAAFGLWTVTRLAATFRL